MSRFRTVLFDLDGTLIDHFTAIYRCHAHTMAQLGLPAPTLAQVRQAVGGGLEAAIERIAGPGHVAEAVPLYRAYWEKIVLEDIVLLPGARELLTELQAQGVQRAVFTNKLGTSSRRICEHVCIASLLDGNFGAKDTPWIKPAPEFTAHVLARLGATAASTLMVGDSPYDIETARQGGFPCWVVTTGTHAAAALRTAGADAVFADLREVQAALTT